ncbi:MAG: DUF2817 domain-containing protein [Bauldia litoralis]
MTEATFAKIPYPAAKDMSDHFLDAAERSGLKVDEYPLVDEAGAPVRGERDEPLATHVTVIGNPDARDTVWVTTALHGCEGPAGTMLAIWLMNHRHGIERALGPDVRIVVAHNLNPWGASHFTRFDADGVDPNRNFRKRFPRTDRWCALSRDYKRLDSHLNPRELSLTTEAWHLGMLWAKSKIITTKRMMKVIALGQRADRDRLLFIGTGPTRTNTLVRDIIRRYSTNQPGIDVHIDIHTGLGKRLSKSKQPLVLTIYEPESAEHALARRLYGEVGEVSSTREGDYSGSDVGTIEQAFFDELPEGRTYHGACVELGSLSTLAAVAAVWRHHAVLRKPKRYSSWYASRSRRAMYDVFFPKDDEWRAEVVPALYHVVGKAVAALLEDRGAFKGMRRLGPAGR